MPSGSFSSRLQEAIARSPLSERQLCAAADISPQALANYVAGRLPKLEQAMALARALDVSVGWFLGEVSSASMDGTKPAIAAGIQTERYPLRRPERVWASLGNPTHKILAVRLGISLERAREILATNALSPQELSALLDEAASIAMAVADVRSHSQSDPAGKGTRLRQGNDR